VLDRASSFSHPEIVALLKNDFVPVAIDQAYQRRQKDAEGRFYQKIANQGPRKIGDGGPTTQGHYIATPDGAFLDYSNHRDPGRLLKILRESLEQYEPKAVAPIEAGEPDSKFAYGPPKGGRVVRVHSRILGGYDETDDPMSRHIETLAAETVRLGLQGRVAGSHLTSMHSMDNYYVSKLLGLMGEAGVAAVANPLINITIQGRHDSYPKRRGQTRVPELRDAGITVGFGSDCVMDPWYSMGRADMLDVASMGLHVGQLSSRADMAWCLRP